MAGGAYLGASLIALPYFKLRRQLGGVVIGRDLQIIDNFFRNAFKHWRRRAGGKGQAGGII